MTNDEIAQRMIVSRRRADTPRITCPVCAGSAMVTPEEVALARGTVRGIYARVEAKRKNQGGRTQISKERELR